jgi:hypothetical protein
MIPRRSRGIIFYTKDGTKYTSFIYVFANTIFYNGDEKTKCFYTFDSLIIIIAHINMVR